MTVSHAFSRIGFQYELHRHQNRFEAVDRESGQDLCHGAIAVRLAQQAFWLDHGAERRAVTQSPGLALDQRDVALPSAVNPVALDAAAGRAMTALPTAMTSSNG